MYENLSARKIVTEILQTAPHMVVLVGFLSKCCASNQRIEGLAENNDIKGPMT
jgi:hypothetical protein